MAYRSHAAKFAVACMLLGNRKASMEKDDMKHATAAGAKKPEYNPESPPGEVVPGRQPDEAPPDRQPDEICPQHPPEIDPADAPEIEPPVPSRIEPGQVRDGK